jgi:ATP/maltotriose-dependent transcriptional regulator MalT
MLEGEHDNVRAALRFSLDTGDSGTALQLCMSLWRFWFERGYLSEGRLWLDESLVRSAEPSRDRVRALTGNGVLAHYQGDYDRAEELSREALALARTLSDDEGVAEATTGIALVLRTRGDYPAAETLFREALSLYETLGDERGVARALDRLGLCLVVTGEMDRARELFEQSLESFRRLGDSHGVALGLYGSAAARQADADGLAAARSSVDESLVLLREAGDRRSYGKALWNVAEINAELGDVETAAGQFEEALTLFVEFGDRWFGAIVLESAAYLAADVGDAERAARLLAAADAIRTALGVPLWVGFRARHETAVAETRKALGDVRFTEEWQQGARTSLDATVGLVTPERPTTTGRDAAEGLTGREVEVLTLIAEGLSDAEVAERLVVSIRTVHAHLRSIYRKLDVRSRSAATRYAFESGLVGEAA